MKDYKIKGTDLIVSRISFGCASLGGWNKGVVDAETVQRAERLVRTAHGAGITLFDHADFYGFGNGELAFGEVLKRAPGLRKQIVIQSKCGQIMPGDPELNDPYRVDLSRKHIVAAVERSLNRLYTDYLDILLLHAPDALMVPLEIGEALAELKKSGKVRYFGVSNHSAGQITRLQKDIDERLIINQVQLGLFHSDLIADGVEFVLEVGQDLSQVMSRSGKAQFTNAYLNPASAGTFDYCCLHGIQIQAWSPLRDLVSASSAGTPRIRKTAELLQTMAEQRGVTPAAIALAWLLTHPAGIVPVLGTLSPEHLLENCEADDIKFDRSEWYTLFASAAQLAYRDI